MAQPAALLAALLLLAPLATASGAGVGNSDAAPDVHVSWPAAAAEAEPAAAAAVAPLLRLLALQQQKQQQRGRPEELRLTLALPAGRSVEVGEGATLQGLVAALLEEQVRGWVGRCPRLGGAATPCLAA